jgi:nucleoside-diphosphate-sugar epimerase
LICRRLYKPIIIPNEGKTKIQFIYSKDLALTIIYLFQNELSSPSIFNVGNKESIDFNEWVSLCGIAANRKGEIIHFDYVKNGYTERDFFPFFDYNNVLDVTKINNTYNKETEILQGLKNCFQWYKQNLDKIQIRESVILNENNIILKFKK